MRIINMLLRFALAAAVAAAVGCGSESSMKVSSELPNTDSATGRTNIVSPIVTNAPGAIDDSKSFDPNYNNYYCYIVFSKDMDPATITPANVYIRDIAGTSIQPLTSTVTYIANIKAAKLEYTLTSGAGSQEETCVVEIFVSRNVTDREGNQLAGFGQSNIPAYANVPLDYRKIINNASVPIAARDYKPLYVKDFSAVALDATTATVTFELSRNVKKSALLTSLFTITGGGAVDTASIQYNDTPSASWPNDYASKISFNITTLSANTMYDVTVNVSGLTIYNADNLYHDGTTAVFTDKTANFMDLHAYDTYSDKRNSDFHTRFATPVTDSTSLIWVNEGSGFGDVVATVLFRNTDDTEYRYVNASTIIPANFIAYTEDGGDYIPIQVKVRHMYDATGVYGAEISTYELGNEDIDRLMILNNVVAATPSSSTPEPIDGNQDYSRLGTIDITGDGVVDDDNWRSW